MDVDPMQSVESLQEASSAAKRNARLNAVAAVSVAILATFMGICKVKDDNIVQAMQQAQADKLDHWSYYQARNVRQEVAEAALTQLRLARADRSGAQAAAYDTEIARYEAIAADQAKKKLEVKAQAEQDQKTYDALNFRDDQFDLSDAALAIAIALLAVTALTQLWWLYWLTWVPMGFGVLMGVAGLGGLGLHPDALVRLLS